jgi:glycosyltransferase involved in cell wall biosynthesis
MSGALNHGLNLARGEYVAFMDSDDLWQPDHLKQLAGVLDAFPRVSMAFSRIEVFGAASDTAVKGREFAEAVARCLDLAFHHWDNGLWLSHERLLATLLRWGVPFRCQASLARRAFIERCRLGFDEDVTYTLDAQFMTMAACHTPFAYIDRVGLRLRRHQGNDGDRSYGAEIERSYRERARKLRYYFSGMPLTREARQALSIRLAQLYGANLIKSWRAMDGARRIRESVNLLVHMPSWFTFKTVVKKWMGA